MSQETVQQIEWVQGMPCIVVTGQGDYQRERPGTILSEKGNGKWEVEYEVAGQVTKGITDRLKPMTVLPKISPVVEPSPETRTQASAEAERAEESNGEHEAEMAQEEKTMQGETHPWADPLPVPPDPEKFKQAFEAFERSGVMAVNANEQLEWPDFILKPDLYNFEEMGGVPGYMVIGREQIKGERHYVSVHPGEDLPRFTPSVTTIKRETAPTPTHLERWRMEMAARYGAAELVHEFVDDCAAYGTIMHGLLVDLVKETLPELGTDKWEMHLRMKIAMQDGRNPDLYYPIWGKALTKDVLALIQWVQDYEVRFLMIEAPLVGELVAGQLDIFCEMNAALYTEKTEPEKRKRVLAIVDLKSGAIVGDHAFQLYLLREILLENYPKFADSKINLYNWSRTDWRKEPTYEFVNWTKEVEQQKKMMGMMLDLYTERTRSKGNPATSMMRIFQGKPTLASRIPDLTGLRTYGEVYLERARLVRNIQKQKP